MLQAVLRGKRKFKISTEGAKRKREVIISFDKYGKFITRHLKWQDLVYAPEQTDATKNAPDRRLLEVQAGSARVSILSAHKEEGIDK